MSVPKGKRREFSLLQIRPLVLSLELEELDVDDAPKENLLVQSERVLGNGVIGDIHDLIVVDIQNFDRSKSHLVAEEVSDLNTKLLAQKRPYVLIGVGRWGSLDQWLGIPVTWDQISGACAIVEAGFKDIAVTPSQGSHFFQNITSFRIGYFTVSEHLDDGFIDWDWLRKFPAQEELTYTRHLRFDESVTVRINGYKNKGIILKPGQK
jgi:hypothetical protein